MKLEIKIPLTNFIIFQFTTVTVIMLLGLFRYVFSYITGYWNLFGFLRLLDVGSEHSIPTYFSTFNLLLSSLLILVIYWNEKIVIPKGSKYWLLLSVLFLCLSIDEGAQFHENFDQVHEYIGIVSPVLKSHGWLLFGVLFIVIMGIVFVPFLKSLPRRTTFYFLLAGIIFIIGAVGFEFMGAVMLYMDFAERSDFIYHLRRIMEEGCEMYGIAIFNCALYREIAIKKLNVTIHSLR